MRGSGALVKKVDGVGLDVDATFFGFSAFQRRLPRIVEDGTVRRLLLLLESCPAETKDEMTAAVYRIIEAFSSDVASSRPVGQSAFPHQAALPQ